MFGFNDPTNPQPAMAPLQSAAVNQQIQQPSYQPQFLPTAGGGYQQMPTQQATFFRDQYGNFDMGNLRTALGGVQAIGSFWNSYQQNKMAKQALGLQTRAFETNLANQTQTYNTALEDRIRARHYTEGRSSAETESYLDKNRL
jgi:hypothetical protein